MLQVTALHTCMIAYEHFDWLFCADFRHDASLSLLYLPMLNPYRILLPNTETRFKVLQANQA